jgi:hypothetical protein
MSLNKIMTKKDQDNLARLYMESTYPRFSNGETFDDDVYTQIRDIVYNMKGDSMQDVIDTISQQLDIRVQNLDSKLIEIFTKLYNQVNNQQDY